MSFGARALIRLGALSHNFQIIKRAAAGSKIMAVIKANAYGHGLVPVARSVPEADSFAVARLQEALELRAAGIANPVVLLAGVLSTDDFDIAAENNCELVVHCEPQLEMLEAAMSASLTVWLKLDSGMNRLGFPLDQAADVIDRLRNCKAVHELRLMTHLASADLRDDPMTAEQLSRFADVARDFDGDISIANSPALFAWGPELRAFFDGRTGTSWIRTGIALYGISPLDGVSAEELGLQPVMQFESRLISVKPVRAGERVGYRGLWTATTDTTIGVISAGYGDGYLRYLPSGTPVLANGRRAPLAGVVSMDMAAVDLGPDATDAVGDTVILWGDGLPVEEIAVHAATIPYQLVTGVMHREPSEQTA